MKVALIVEGLGDVMAYPTLVAKTAEVAGLQVFAPNPIRAGGFGTLSRPGELERFVRMAALRQDADFVLVAVDLDDGCPAEAHRNFCQRCAEAAQTHNKDVRTCFSVREYEGWFLENIGTLRASAPEYEWIGADEIPNAHLIRGAKQELGKHMRRHYKESVDQSLLTKKLDVYSLYGRSRSFRKFARAVTGKGYEELGMYFAT